MSIASVIKAPGSLRCRPITDDDLDAVVGLLMKGFADRSEAYWRQGLARHVNRALPAGYPVYGFLLEAGGRAVGVLLTLHTALEVDGRTVVRCSLSSWYLEPEYQSQGSLLEKVATRRPDVTYLDVTPSPPTRVVVEARGFRRYCTGQMLVIPILSRPRRGASIRVASVDDPMPELSPVDREIMRDHIGYGCLGLVCVDESGACPLVLQVRTIGLLRNVKRFGQVPCMQLVYARRAEDVARFAGAIGRLILRRHRTPLLIIDATGHLPGLIGRYFEGRAVKYLRGPNEIALGDLAYTELVLFGP